MSKEVISNPVEDFNLEVRKVKALEKIALNLEALTLFCESLNTQDWDSRIQWYLDMVKKAYLDPKLEDKTSES